MRILGHLFENNREWADKISAEDPEFFKELSNQQNPEYLWIGCSDSRVPANQIINLPPGEVFVHRNIANVVVHTDMNCLSVIQYAVDFLKVKHIIVCGHYGCGGVEGAMNDSPKGLVDNWLGHVRDVYKKHEDALDGIEKFEDRRNKLCELNVIEQVANVCGSTIIQDAWKRGQELAVHGWVYSLENGLLHDLNICVRAPEELSSIYKTAIAKELGAAE
ncbi:carbonate dehydratase [Tichowtungia aerotolerans]|uniref:Carbonic anhydrase n=1 Tax=Tichowtungia aerotolerans TaxID=2697043 RepID=A0A6P1M0Q8_9BACT|nr:carbonate dehydratase [Tichowtungia aerotolerans]QHI68140.1 carbonate dehydratase [Tichowtungia aerotolerans]